MDITNDQDNPRAFPLAGHYDRDAEFHTGTELGMTLLDYFAREAMGRFIQREFDGATHAEQTWLPDPKWCARWSYDYAEAMLAEREKRMGKSEG